jgi:carbonic anhydrase
MQRLIDGYRRFRDDNWPERRRLMQTLALEGQSPVALVVACADSRADPAMIFDAAPGELFVVRNVANLVPPFAPDAAYHGTSAALEFGVRVLQIPELIVLGHANCGGIKALMHGAPDAGSDFVAPWISIAEPVRKLVLKCYEPQDWQSRAEQETVKLSVRNLMTFPWIAERVEAGSLRLHGAHFGIYTGVLSLMQEDGSFAPA